MMNCFPLLYEDELFYSIVARYRRMNGITSGKALTNDLFGSQITLSSAYFPTHIHDLISNLPYSSRISEDLILGNHTLYPFFTSFLSRVATEDIYESVKEGKGQRVILKMGMAGNDVAMNNHLRFCPLCFKEDIKELGESYWRRLHQIPGVLYCIKHKCKLLDSTVKSINSRSSQDCSDMDTCRELEDIMQIGSNLKRLNIELGNQVNYLLKNISGRKDLNFIIDFYVDRLRELKFASLSGNIYMKVLEREFIDFYTQEYLKIMQVGIDTEKESNWLRLFVRDNNKNRNPIKHLLFLQFLGINIEELFACNKVIGKKIVSNTHVPNLNRKEMRGKMLKIIEENPKASRTELKGIGKGIYTWIYRYDSEWYEQVRPPLKGKKGQSKFVDWRKRDKEWLEICKRAVTELLEDNGKPIRISKSTIRKQLGFNTSFNNVKLVKTHKYIIEVSEDIYSYRIRKIRWAINAMLEKDYKITPYKVQLYAGFGGNNKEVRPLIDKELLNM